jgi:hypothetical protein
VKSAREALSSSSETELTKAKSTADCDSQPATLASLAHSFCAGPTVKALKQASDVHLDCAWAEIQSRGSLLVGEAGCEKVENFTLAASRARSLEGRCGIESSEQGARPEAPGDLGGFVLRLPDDRGITVTTCETPLHPGCFQRKPGLSEQFDCFVKFMNFLAGMAFGARGFACYRSQRGTRLRIVVVLSDRIQNVYAVSDVLRTITVRVKRRREQKA